MFKTILSLSVAAMTLVLVSAAHADELPTDSVCHIAAESAYDAAVASGSGLPDGEYEQTMGDCESWEASDPYWAEGEDAEPVAAESATEFADAMIGPVASLLR